MCIGWSPPHQQVLEHQLGILHVNSTLILPTWRQHLISQQRAQCYSLLAAHLGFRRTHHGRLVPTTFLGKLTKFTETLNLLSHQFITKDIKEYVSAADEERCRVKYETGYRVALSTQTTFPHHLHVFTSLGAPQTRGSGGF